MEIDALDCLIDKSLHTLSVPLCIPESMLLDCAEHIADVAGQRVRGLCMEARKHEFLVFYAGATEHECAVL